MSISVLLSIFLSTPMGDAPDLCSKPQLGPDGAEIRDSTGLNLSLYCEPTGPDVPVWDDNVCCETTESGAACVAAPSRETSCSTGSLYYCEYGERGSAGEVTCYQPLPTMCDAGLCVEAPAEDPPGVALIDPLISCCDANGNCVWVGYNVEGCEGEILICLWGMTMEDGTVECFE